MPSEDHHVQRDEDSLEYERPKFRVLKPTLGESITTTINSSSRKASGSPE